LLLLAIPAAAEVLVRGRVVDENGVAVAAARVTAGNLAPLFSTRTGHFVLRLPEPGDYRFSADHEGFFALRNQTAHLTEGDNDVTLVLNHLREFVEQVDVVYSPPAIDPEQPAAQQALTGIEVLEVPFPAAHDLRNALPMFQGVVQDEHGDLHIHGGGADQNYWSLDGFNITDPVTGRLDVRLSIDAVRSLDLQSGRYSADTGKGSAGSIDLKTGMGDDRYRFSATNFVPGVETSRDSSSRSGPRAPPSPVRSAGAGRGSTTASTPSTTSTSSRSCLGARTAPRAGAWAT